MKINRYYNKSLSKRVVFLMGGCILFFMIGMIILALLQHQLNQKYMEQRSKIVFQRNVLMDIYDQFNTVFIGMTGMTTNHNPQLKDEVLSHEADIQKLTEELQKAINNEIQKPLLLTRSINSERFILIKHYLLLSKQTKMAIHKK